MVPVKTGLLGSQLLADYIGRAGLPDRSGIGSTGQRRIGKAADWLCRNDNIIPVDGWKDIDTKKLLKDSN